MLEAVGVPGAEGAASPGTEVPSQLPPLSLQLDGEPGPLPLKPKETEAPGASVPFQPTFLAVQWSPELVTVASQAEVTLVPVGKSHSTVQELREVVPVFFTVQLPPKPVPQSEVLAKVAVALVAAWAGLARPTRPARGSARVAASAAALCLKRMCASLYGDVVEGMTEPHARSAARIERSGP